MSLGPVMVGVDGTALRSDEREMLMHPLVGGAVLFTRNFESPEQVAELVRGIHDLREPHLLVAVDQEGGRVQRFRNGFTPLPAVNLLGRIHDAEPARARRLAEATGWLMSIELRSVGVDFSFAPVVDLDGGRGFSAVIGDRAFHGDPEVVSALAQSYVRGMNRAGMAATAKHFPGHGSVREDSHHTVPVDQRPFEDILGADCVPFERLIHTGVTAVMAAHVVYERVDARAAGFSEFWLREILRGRMDFQGVIFSDDLTMVGARCAGSVPESARCALEAGCDMILVCQGFDTVAEVLDSLAGWSDPVSQLRLVRMHGRHPVARPRLHGDPRWRRAVELVESYAEPYTPDLLDSI